MARRKTNKVATLLVLSILALAAYGVYVLLEKREAKSTIQRIEKSVKAARKAW